MGAYDSSYVDSLKLKEVNKNNYNIDTMPWQMECAELFKGLGFDYSLYSIQMLPYDKLKELNNKYKMQSVEVDDYGHFFFRNPVPNYLPKSDNAEVELYSLGRTLGLLNDLGKYYYFIPDINFSRGFWLGRFEKAVSDNDFNQLKMIQDDIKFLKPDSFYQEMAIINNNMFKFN